MAFMMHLVAMRPEDASWLGWQNTPCTDRKMPRSGNLKLANVADIHNLAVKMQELQGPTPANMGSLC